MSARITTPKNPKGAIDILTSSQKTSFVSGDQLLTLRGGHFVRKKPYEGIVITIDQLAGDEAGSLRVNVRFGMTRMVVFTLGWKNKQADICIGDDCFRIELT